MNKLIYIHSKLRHFLYEHIFLALSIYTILGSIHKQYTAISTIFFILFIILTNKKILPIASFLFFIFSVLSIFYNNNFEYIKTLNGDGELQIKENHHLFKSSYGLLKKFTPKYSSIVYKNIPVKIAYNKNITISNLSKIEGSLNYSNNQFYLTISSFKSLPKKTKIITKIQLEVHKWLKKKLALIYKTLDARDFAYGITLGKMNNKKIIHTFRRLGVSHIIAISGFHFSIGISSISLLMWFLPRKIHSLFLLITSIALFIILPKTPSVIRAAISCFLVILMRFSYIKMSSLDRLGIAMISLLFINIEMVYNVSFCLSTSATLGIILFYRLMYKKISSQFSSTNNSRLRRIYYIIRKPVIQALSITISASILSIPFNIIFFKSIALNGFIYNIIFPILSCIVIYGTTIGLVLNISLIHKSTEKIVSFMMYISDYPPIELKRIIITHAISEHIIATYLLTICLIGFYKYKEYHTHIIM